MKKLVFILVLFILSGCSSTKFVDSWRSKEITSFKPNRILVIGVTDNLTARKIFEEKLKQAFILRNINADESLNVINKTFTSTQRTEEEINDLIEGLALKGYDAVLITTLKGVEEKEATQKVTTLLIIIGPDLEDIIIVFKIFITHHNIMKSIMFTMLNPLFII